MFLKCFSPWLGPCVQNGAVYHGFNWFSCFSLTLRTLRPTTASQLRLKDKFEVDSSLSLMTHIQSVRSYGFCLLNISKIHQFLSNHLKYLHFNHSHFSLETNEPTTYTVLHKNPLCYLSPAILFPHDSQTTFLRYRFHHATSYFKLIVRKIQVKTSGTRLGKPVVLCPPFRDWSLFSSYLLPLHYVYFTTAIPNL